MNHANNSCISWVKSKQCSQKLALEHINVAAPLLKVSNQLKATHKHLLITRAILFAFPLLKFSTDTARLRVKDCPLVLQFRHMCSNCTVYASSHWAKIPRMRHTTSQRGTLIQLGRFLFCFKYPNNAWTVLIAVREVSSLTYSFINMRSMCRFHFSLV